MCLKVNDGEAATGGGEEGGEIEEALPNNKRHRGIPAGVLPSSPKGNDGTLEGAIDGEDKVWFTYASSGHAGIVMANVLCVLCAALSS